MHVNGLSGDMAATRIACPPRRSPDCSVGRSHGGREVGRDHSGRGRRAQHTRQQRRKSRRDGDPPRVDGDHRWALRGMSQQGGFLPSQVVPGNGGTRRKADIADGGLERRSWREAHLEGSPRDIDPRFDVWPIPLPALPATHQCGSRRQPPWREAPRASAHPLPSRFRGSSARECVRARR